MDKVTVPVYSLSRPEITSTVEMDPETIEDMKTRSQQTQLMRSGLRALSAIGGAAAGFTANPNAGPLQRTVNAIGGGSLATLASGPVTDLIARQMMKGPAKRYSDEFNSQLPPSQLRGLGEKEQLDEIAFALPALGPAAGWAAGVATALLGALGIHTAVEHIQDRDPGVPIAPIVEPSSGGGGPSFRDLTFGQIKSLMANRDPFNDDRFVGASFALGSEKYKTYKRLVDKYVTAVPGKYGSYKDIFTGFTGTGRGSGATELAQRKAYAEASKAATTAAANSAATAKNITIYLTLSIAALLAAGYTVMQVSRLVKKVRINLKRRKASMDIIKLASMGDVEGARMVLDKEFANSGVNIEKVAEVVKDVSKDDLEVAAQVLRKELLS